MFRGEAARRPDRGKHPVGATDLQHLRRLYQGNLRHPDQEVGRLVEALRERGVLERSILVLTSDHGESLGERGAFGHGNGVDRELVPIPLLIRLPARVGLTGRRRAPVGTVDLMPTLLDLVGLQVPESVDGSSLLHLLQEPGAVRWFRPLLSWAGSEGASTVAAYGAGFKYVFDSTTGREALFTMEEQEDGEDLRAARPVTFDYLAFSSHLQGATDLQGAPPGHLPEAEEGEPPLDPQGLEALRALGYVE